MTQVDACPVSFNRRGFLTAAAASFLSATSGHSTETAAPKAKVALTLDLEMSRNFPRWEDMRWDYEKGNLNDETKAYAVEAARRVKKAGGVIHFFAVGRVLEQENVDWLLELAREGHPIGNHTYDHVNVWATTSKDTQFRFQRAPWLIEGRSPAEIIRENIRLTTKGMKQRVGIDLNGFRTPGGNHRGLIDRPDLQRMLLDEGFTWVSSLYPSHPMGKPSVEPSEADYAGIVEAQRRAQPFVYPSGLIELPMSPVSDVTVFRNARWKLGWFLEALRRGVRWCIEQGACFDFLSHPSCLYVMDPRFEAIDMICQMVRENEARAELTDLGKVAQSVKR